jgi:hypothetical protein
LSEGLFHLGMKAGASEAIRASNQRLEAFPGDLVSVNNGNGNRVPVPGGRRSSNLEGPLAACAGYTV